MKSQKEKIDGIIKLKRENTLWNHILTSLFHKGKTIAEKKRNEYIIWTSNKWTGGFYPIFKIGFNENKEISKSYNKFDKILRNKLILSIWRNYSSSKIKFNKLNFNLFAVDADQKLRYERIVERASETDKVTFGTFSENEAREMNSTDPNKQNISACVLLADFKFTNNGTLDELYHEIDLVLEKIK